MEYTNKTVLITGGAGFIGSHVADILIENGYEVVIADIKKTDNVPKGAKFYETDILSSDFNSVFRENKIDFVFHFAAQASVGVSTKDPLFDANQNIIASVKLFNLSKEFRVKKVVIASTAAVYGVPEYLPINEKHKVTCLSFYGLSKYTMENYIKMYDFDYIIFRFANVYGPRQNAHGEAGVVAIFADKMKNNEEIIIQDDGEQTRDFVYVKDVAHACLCAIKSDVKNETVNVSTNRAVSINELFSEMSKIFGYTKKPIYFPPRQGDIKHSILDNSKCKKLFSLNSYTSLSEGLIKLSQTNCEAK